MYEIRVSTEFCAAHAIVMGGVQEKVHGHNWQVTAIVEGPTLDSDGLLCDFHTVETSLRDIVSRFHNGNLNETAPFDRLNPTAEHVALHLYESLDEALSSLQEASVRVASVSVSEAPGCVAVCKGPTENQPQG